MPRGNKIKFYAVAKGRKCGIYKTWGECEAQTKGCKGARFKSFPTLDEAQRFIDLNSSSTPTTSTTTKTLVPLHTTERTNEHRKVNGQEAPRTKKACIGIGIRGKCYAVAKGHNPGIYATWDECKRQTTGFRRPVFKKFTDEMDAAAFMSEHNDDWKGLTDEGGGLGSSTTAIVEEATISPTVTNMPSMVVGRRQQQHTENLLIQLWFDGGSRGNPGIAGAGAHLVISTTTPKPKPESRLLNHAAMASALPNTYTKTGDDLLIDKKVKTVDVRHYCGKKFTNNYAEYCGLREGLVEAKYYVDAFCRATVTRTQGKGMSPFATSDDDNKMDCHANHMQYQIEVDIKGDSKLIIEQLKGNYACRKTTLQKLYRECTELISDIRNQSKTTNTIKKRKRNDHTSNTDDDMEYNHISVIVRYAHVYREENKIADSLANEAMDKQKSWKTCQGDDGINIVDV